MMKIVSMSKYLWTYGSEGEDGLVVGFLPSQGFSGEVRFQTTLVSRSHLVNSWSLVSVGRNYSEQPSQSREPR